MAFLSLHKIDLGYAESLKKKRTRQMSPSYRERMSADGRTDTVGENSKIAA